MEEPRNRVVELRRFGGADGLKVSDAPLPDPGRSEVRIRVLASSIEYTDVTIRRRLYPWVRRQPPFVMGEIDRLGDGVSGLHIGERVADMTVIRANADYCTLAANRVTSPPAWGGVGDGRRRNRRMA